MFERWWRWRASAVSGPVDQVRAHLADVTSGQGAGGERDQVALSHIAVRLRALPRMFARGHPRGVLGSGRAHPAGSHRLQHHPSQLLLGQPRPQFRHPGGKPTFGDADGRADCRDLIRRLDAPLPA